MSDDSTSSGGAYRPGIALYAVALQQARTSGNEQQMRELAARARAEGSDDPEIQAALRELEAEIAKSGNR
jgi:hypothetical protein